jgi:beta-galactosidase
VPDAQDLLHFSIMGGARIVGVGNGNPSSHEPDKCADGGWQRHLFNGRCQVIVQSGLPAGPGLGSATFTVTGDGLQSAQARVSLDPAKNQ